MNLAQKNQLNKLYQSVTSLYHYILVDSKYGQNKLEEILKQGLTEDTLKELDVGLVSNEHILQEYLHKYKYSPQTLLESGMFTQTNLGMLEEVFNDELVVPIKNGYNKVTGLVSLDNPDKIVSTNNPQYVLFNYYQAINALDKQEDRCLYLVSDPTSVIYAKQAGLETVVAPATGKLIPGQINSLDKNHNRLVMIADYDLKKTVKWLEIIEKQAPNLDIALVLLSDQLSVKDYVRQFSGQKFLDQLQQRTDAKRWHLNYLAKNYYLGNVRDKTLYVNQAVKVIASESDLSKRSKYIQILAKQVDWPEERLTKNVENLRNILIKNSQERQRKREEERFRHAKQRHDQSFFQQSIKDYLNMQGISYQQQGQYLRLVEHDSLVIDTRKTSQQPYESWYWNSRGFGGDLYTFMLKYEGLNKQEAFKRLKELANQTPVLEKKEVKAIVYDPKEWCGIDKRSETIKYLVEVRKLDEQLVNKLFDFGAIRQLENNAIFFSWKDETDKEVGGEQQGTWIDHKRYGKRGTFKMIAEGSKKDWGFNFGKQLFTDEKYSLYVFESPLDALSFYQLHKQEVSPNTKYLSLSGAGTKVKTIENFITNYQEKLGAKSSEVHLCFDQDEAGRKAITKALRVLEKMGYHGEIKLDHPGGSVKDWNESLQKGFSGHEVKELKKGPAQKAIQAPDMDKAISPGR